MGRARAGMLASSVFSMYLHVECRGNSSMAQSLRYSATHHTSLSKWRAVTDAQASFPSPPHPTLPHSQSLAVVHIGALCALQCAPISHFPALVWISTSLAFNRLCFLRARGCWDFVAILYTPEDTWHRCALARLENGKWLLCTRVVVQLNDRRRNFAALCGIWWNPLNLFSHESSGCVFLYGS